MARYIDADAFKQKLADRGIFFPALYANELNEMPTADVVEVVRCKDCVKRQTPDCTMWYQCSVCGGQWSWENDAAFCSLGERKGT